MANDIINPYDFTAAVSKLRHFFENKGFVEVHTQNRLSILAACEDPTTIATYNYEGQIWPLPQTGQMWLEYELLSNPAAPGFFCVSTSYRQEPNPIPGRHNTIFPMFEFEFPGTMEDLEVMENELCEFLGFPGPFTAMDYVDAASHYDVEILENEQEEAIAKDFNNVFLLKNFPIYTSPFWNMKKNGNTARKIDVLLYGMETIGSAERSCNTEEMADLFYTISDGMYADILFDKFGRDRVVAELNEFLNFNFFERCGGGIGVTRMIRALKLLEQDTIQKVA